jgi:MoaA/NifB/PqqE/SkfB family radical SAM enzyme
MPTGLSNELFPDAAGRVNPHRMIPRAKALEIVEDCAELGVKAIQFTGGGEPTVHPDYLEIFGRAQELGMDTALVTNGVKLLPNHPSVLAMKWVRVSIDAGDASTYAKVRQCPSSHWDKAWANIRALHDADYVGTLGVGYVVAPESYMGIAEAARLAKAAGASNMRVGAVFSTEGYAYYGDLIGNIQTAIERAKFLHDGDGFEVIDLFWRRIGDLAEGHPKDPDCGYQFLTMYIGGDQNVYRCCNTAYTTAGKVGSLKNQRLRDAMLDYLPFDARTCRHCQFLGQNLAIKAMTEKPQHVNFV